MKYVNYQKKITLADIESVEKELDITFPEDFKEHYLQYNGGHPEYDKSAYIMSILFKDKKGTRRRFSSFLPIKYKEEIPYVYATERGFMLWAPQDGKTLHVNIEEMTKKAWGKKRLPSDVVVLTPGNPSICMHRKTQQIVVCKWYYPEENKDCTPEQFFKKNMVVAAETFSEFLTIFTFSDRDSYLSIDGELVVIGIADPSKRKKRLVCTNCAKKITAHDIEQVEKELNMKFPEPFKKFYLKYNGGEPNRSEWIDPKEILLELDIHSFLPIRYYNPIDAYELDPNYTLLELWTKTAWEKNLLPKNLVPFAEDECGNHFCLGKNDGKVYFVDHELWHADVPENNSDNGIQLLASSFKKFLSELVALDEGDDE